MDAFRAHLEGQAESSADGCGRCVESSVSDKQTQKGRIVEKDAKSIPFRLYRIQTRCGPERGCDVRRGTGTKVPHKWVADEELIRGAALAAELASGLYVRRRTNIPGQGAERNKRA